MRITRHGSQDVVRERYTKTKRQHKGQIRSVVSGDGRIQSPAPLLANGVTLEKLLTSLSFGFLSTRWGLQEYLPQGLCDD